MFAEVAGGAAKGVDGIRFARLLRAAGVCAGPDGIASATIDVAFSKAQNSQVCERTVELRVLFMLLLLLLAGRLACAR